MTSFRYEESTKIAALIESLIVKAIDNDPFVKVDEEGYFVNLIVQYQSNDNDMYLTYKIGGRKLGVGMVLM
jgi:hypothetical protein